MAKQKRRCAVIIVTYISVTYILTNRKEVLKEICTKGGKPIANQTVLFQFFSYFFAGTPNFIITTKKRPISCKRPLFAMSDSGQLRGQQLKEHIILAVYNAKKGLLHQLDINVVSPSILGVAGGGEEKVDVVLPSSSAFWHFPFISFYAFL